MTTAVGNIFAYNALQVKPGADYIYPPSPYGTILGNKNATSLSFYNNTAPYDLWPKTNLLNAANGESWIPAVDFMGVPRPSYADAGAFQHTSTVNNHLLYPVTPRPLRVGESTLTMSTSTSTTSTSSSSMGSTDTTTTTSTSTSTSSTTSSTSTSTTSMSTSSSTSSTSGSTSSSTSSTDVTATSTSDTTSTSSTSGTTSDNSTTSTTSVTTSSTTGSNSTISDVTTASTTTSDKEAVQSDSNSGLPVGAIIGIAIGASVLIAGIVAALFILAKRRRNNKPPPKDDVPLESVITTTTSAPVVAPVVTEIKDVEVKVRLGGGNFGDVYQGVWQVKNYILHEYLCVEIFCSCSEKAQIRV